MTKEVLEHELTTMLQIDIEVHCDTCEAELHILSIDETEPYYICVGPCEDCLNVAAKKAEGAEAEVERLWGLLSEARDDLREWVESSPNARAEREFTSALLARIEKEVGS